AEAQHHQRGGLEPRSIGAEQDRHRIQHQECRDRADRCIGQESVRRVPQEGPVHQVLEETPGVAERLVDGARQLGQPGSESCERSRPALKQSHPEASHHEVLPESYPASSSAKSRKVSTCRSISSTLCCTESVHWSSGPGGSRMPRLARKKKNAVHSSVSRPMKSR